MDLLRLIARPLLAAPFVVDGLDAVTRPAKHVERLKVVTNGLERLGLPPVMDADAALLARASGAVSVLAGLGLATGVAPRSCATVLATLNVPLTLVNNPVWLRSSAQVRTERLSGLTRGAALGAGLVMAALDRGGKPSLAWWLSNEREHRAELSAVREATAAAVEQAVASRYVEV
ncbi:DoxX family membrane protein [Actinomyces weissii]|uniref:DoxX family membrane protein n=1 Tax=Actinomyces weissii TaxID=675090 RepID=A0A7T7M8S6_9ACTO|nr:DoxX family membrane protein [Actinomyces weissii]QQM66952.1 DoxX family membrane protein [Actinomyces weissii]